MVFCLKCKRHGHTSNRCWDNKEKTSNNRDQRSRTSSSSSSRVNNRSNSRNTDFNRAEEKQIESCSFCGKNNHISEHCFFKNLSKPRHEPLPPADLEKQKIKELNDLCRNVFASSQENYGSDVEGEELKEREEKAREIRQQEIKEIFGNQKKIRNIQICILLDVTQSMDLYIREVRKSITQIVKWLTEKQNCRQKVANDFKLALVAYRDFCDEHQFEVLNFTDSETFRNFCKSLKAEGGGDEPEDVFGGIEHALKLKWNKSYGTKVLFHITDNPCHGNKYHNIQYDHYPDGDPMNRTENQLFNEMREQNIQYYFGKITDYTNKMIKIFSNAYGQEIKEFNIKNVSQLSNSIMVAISSSITIQQNKLRECKNSKLKINFDKSEPNWNILDKIEGRKICYILPKLINEIGEILKEWPESRFFCKIAIHPFQQGMERLVFYGRNETFDQIQDMVFKQYKNIPKSINISRLYKTPNEMSTIAGYFAKLFNDAIIKSLGHIEQSIKFLKINTIKLFIDGEEHYFCSEMRFQENDEFLKFTSNGDYSLSEEEAKKKRISPDLIHMLLAFTHYTYQKSNKYLMISDLQGIICDNKDKTKTVLLTDPSIHCVDELRFGYTNGAQEGMNLFFSRHFCNRFCKALDLRKSE